MIKLKDIKNQKINDINLNEILFFTFPLSFILGNLILSLHLLLFIISSLFLIKKHQLTSQFSKLNILLTIFFLYLFALTTIQFPDIFKTFNEGLDVKINKIPLENNPIFKSFLLIRFVILIVVVEILFSNGMLNLKKFFLCSLICTSFVSVDVIIQYITGYDLFGYKNITAARNPGPFGDEAISGSFLQRFSLIAFFSIYFINFKNQYYNKILLFFIVLIISLGVLLGGNRMPMILFLFGCSIALIFMKNYRLILIFGLVAFFSIFFTIISKNEAVYDRYYSIFKEINFLAFIKKTPGPYVSKVEIEKKEFTEEEKLANIESWEKGTGLKFEKITNSSIAEKIERGETTWGGTRFLRGGTGSLFRTSLEMWKLKPIFGHGLKSFRFVCWDILSKTNDIRLSCSNHSHNYYFEILSEVGIVGISLIIIFFIIILKKSLVWFYSQYKQNNQKLYFFIPIFITFFVEIWPLKSTGSFFTTWNATFLWLTTSILLAIIYKKKFI